MVIDAKSLIKPKIAILCVEHEDNLQRIMCPESFGWSDLDFDPSIKVKLVADMKKTSRKSCVPCHFVGSEFTFYPLFKIKLVFATFNRFLLLSLYSEAQNTMSADTEPVHGH